MTAFTERLNRSEGGTDKASRLLKGWTGPVSQLGNWATNRWPSFFMRALKKQETTDVTDDTDKKNK